MIYLIGLIERIPTRRGLGQTTGSFGSEKKAEPLVSSQPTKAFHWIIQWFIFVIIKFHRWRPTYPSETERREQAWINFNNFKVYAHDYKFINKLNFLRTSGVKLQTSGVKLHTYIYTYIQKHRKYRITKILPNPSA